MRINTIQSLDPWLKSVKKEANMLMHKFRSDYDELNRIMRKEQNVIALIKHIRDTYKRVEVMQCTENLTMSGIFDESPRLDILLCWPSNDNNEDDTDSKVNVHMKIALRQYHKQC